MGRLQCCWSGCLTQSPRRLRVPTRTHVPPMMKQQQMLVRRLRHSRQLGRERRTSTKQPTGTQQQVPLPLAPARVCGHCRSRADEVGRLALAEPPGLAKVPSARLRSSSNSFRGRKSKGQGRWHTGSLKVDSKGFSVFERWRSPCEGVAWELGVDLGACHTSDDTQLRCGDNGTVATYHGGVLPVSIRRA